MNIGSGPYEGRQTQPPWLVSLYVAPRDVHRGKRSGLRRTKMSLKEVDKNTFPRAKCSIAYVTRPWLALGNGWRTTSETFEFSETHRRQMAAH